MLMLLFAFRIAAELFRRWWQPRAQRLALVAIRASARPSRSK
jgi:hypothetical protein